MDRSRTILVVDDDTDILNGLQFLLEEQGYRVLTALDGEAGLAVISVERPHLVVMDMMMPKKSGFIVLQHVKELDDPPAAIMISANGGRFQRAYAESLGVDDFLQKPFSSQQLLDSVRRLCPIPAEELQPAVPQEVPAA